MWERLAVATAATLPAWSRSWRFATRASSGGSPLGGGFGVLALPLLGGGTPPLRLGAAAARRWGAALASWRCRCSGAGRPRSGWEQRRLAAGGRLCDRDDAPALSRVPGRSSAPWTSAATAPSGRGATHRWSGDGCVTTLGRRDDQATSSRYLVRDRAGCRASQQQPPQGAVAVRPRRTGLCCGIINPAPPRPCLHCSTRKTTTSSSACSPTSPSS